MIFVAVVMVVLIAILRGQEDHRKSRYRWTVNRESTNLVLCRMHLIAQEGPRDEVCPSLPSDVPFGEPFVVRSTRECSRWGRELASFCSGQVVVNASRASTQDGHRHYSFPLARSGPRRDCSSRVVNFFKAPWPHYQLGLQTERLCSRRPMECFKAGEWSSFNCTYDDLRLPRGSIARDVGDRCRAVDLADRPGAWLPALRGAIATRTVAPPPLGAIVVHVPAADVDNSASMVAELLDVGDFHVKPLSYYERAVPTDLASGKRVVLVAAETATLEQPVPFKSCLFVHALKDFFLDNRNASVVDVRVGETPDDDLIFMAHSTFFVPAAGASSRLAATLVRDKGGTVLDDDNSDFSRRPTSSSVNEEEEEEEDLEDIAAVDLLIN